MSEAELRKFFKVNKTKTTAPKLKIKKVKGETAAQYQARGKKATDDVMDKAARQHRYHQQNREVELREKQHKQAASDLLKGIESRTQKKRALEGGVTRAKYLGNIFFHASASDKRKSKNMQRKVWHKLI